MEASPSAEEFDRLRDDVDNLGFQLGTAQSEAHDSAEKLKECQNSLVVMESERNLAVDRAKRLEMEMTGMRYRFRKQLDEAVEQALMDNEEEMKSKLEGMTHRLIMFGFNNFRSRLLAKFPDLDVSSIVWKE